VWHEGLSQGREISERGRFKRGRFKRGRFKRGRVKRGRVIRDDVAWPGGINFRPTAFALRP
jgi:hypothetical protein